MMHSAAAFLTVLLPAVSGQAALWAQCKQKNFLEFRTLIIPGGGSTWSGETTCVANACCTVSNQWYSQCIPCTGAGSSSSTKTPSSTSVPSSTATPSSTSTSAAVTSTATCALPSKYSWTSTGPL